MPLVFRMLAHSPRPKDREITLKKTQLLLPMWLPVGSFWRSCGVSLEKAGPFDETGREKWPLCSAVHAQWISSKCFIHFLQPDVLHWNSGQSLVVQLSKQKWSLYIYTHTQNESEHQCELRQQEVNGSENPLTPLSNYSRYTVYYKTLNTLTD